MTTRYPESHRLVAERALRRYFPTDEVQASNLLDAMSYSLFSGGKRFRPVLAMLAAEAVGGTAESVLPVACAIEYIHTYSLIHDDLPAIDDDDVRRNRPTCHVRFGEAMAIMAGDALFAEAFWLINHRQEGSGDVLVWVNRELSEATGMRGMVGGQVRDIECSAGPATAEAVAYIHELKTGRLITAAARCGARLGGADEEQMAAISAYAGELGLAFQIVDDILDVVGDARVTGKAVGSDQLMGKSTYPSVHGVDYSRRLAAKAVGRAKGFLQQADLRGEDMSGLADFVLGRDS